MSLRCFPVVFVIFLHLKQCFGFDHAPKSRADSTIKLRSHVVIGHAPFARQPDEAPNRQRGAVIVAARTTKGQFITANYRATARSNYFVVKDAAAFEAWCQERDIKTWQA